MPMSASGNVLYTDPTSNQSVDSKIPLSQANIYVNGIDTGLRVVSVTKLTAPSTVTPKYYKIDPAATSVLTANLNITDANIHVANAAVFGSPNTEFAIPGVVYIGGEKITYYVRDTVNNVLGQIRRAVDGTGAPMVHPAGESVVETNIEQLIPGGSAVHTTTWLNPPPNFAAYVGDQSGNQLSDGLGDVLVTIPLNSIGIADGGGFEGSITPQVKFLKGIS